MRLPTNRFPNTINLFLTYRDEGVLATLHTFATNKKSGYERESAGVAFRSLATTLGPASLPLLLPSLPTLLDLLADKGDVVRDAASAAIRSIIKLTPVEAIGAVADILSAEIDKGGKWQAKAGCLKEIAKLVDSKGEESKEEVAGLLGVLLPIVENAMHDTKKEVGSPSSYTFCSKVDIISIFRFPVQLIRQQLLSAVPYRTPISDPISLRSSLRWLRRPKFQTRSRLFRIQPSFPK